MSSAVAARARKKSRSSVRVFVSGFRSQQASRRFNELPSVSRASNGVSYLFDYCNIFEFLDLVTYRNRLILFLFTAFCGPYRPTLQCGRHLSDWRGKVAISDGV